MSNLLAAARSLLELAFPGKCALCGCETGLLPDPTEHPVCSDCIRGLRPIEGPRCRVCGARLLSESAVCVRCRETGFRFESALPLFEYAGAVRELIYLYKFEGRRRIARLFAEWAAAGLSGWRPAALVVPVPGRPGVLRRRGWEHVGEIAGLLERRYRVLVSRCLERSGGAQQKGLGFAARSENVRGRIHFRGAELAAGSSVVLLDDVLTTGATADECAAVLRAHGAAKVDLLTLAID